jgi:hypothetical protein
MRKFVLALILLCAAFSTIASDFRLFTSTDGKTIQGKVIRIEPKDKKVTIQRDNGVMVTVPMAIFCAEDQEHFKEWIKFEGIQSESKFKISCSRRVVKKWTEEMLGTINYTSGATEKNQVVGKKKFNEIGFDIAIRNNNNYDIKNVTVKYCIFYEQDSGGGSKAGVRFGSEKLELIPSRTEHVISSKTVQVCKLETNAEFLNSRVEKGDVDGIWVKICVEDKNGNLITLRETSTPDSLLKSKTWSDTSKLVGNNKED